MTKYSIEGNGSGAGLVTLLSVAVAIAAAAFGAYYKGRIDEAERYCEPLYTQDQILDELEGDSL